MSGYFTLSSIGIAAIAVMLSAQMARCDDIPSLNVDQVCRVIAAHASGPGERGGPDLSFGQCVKSEQVIRDKVVALWSKFAPADRAACVGEATAGGDASYTDLLTCLQMTRDARNRGFDASPQ